jgi:Ca-activated chloride channel family protein
MPVFERPLFLLALLLAPALAFLLRRMPKPPEALFGFSFSGPPGPATLSQAVESPGMGLRRAKSRAARFFFWTGLSIASLSASGPALVSRDVVFLERGRDVIFVLDASPSMSAADFGSSRFEGCLGIIKDFAQAGGNSSLGLVAFGSEAALSVPPTENRGFFLERLSALEPGAFGEGTAIGMGMATAVYHLRSSRAPSRLMVVFTDGENNCGAISPERAAALAAQNRISLILIGVGSRGEVRVSWRDPKTGKTMEGSYASDFDEGKLQQLALEADGSFYAARDADAMKRVKAQIVRAAAPLGRSRESSRATSLVFPLMLCALASLAISFLLECVLGQEATCP